MLSSLEVRGLRVNFDEACRKRDSVGELLPDNVKMAIHLESSGVPIPSTIQDRYSIEIIQYKNAQKEVDEFYGRMMGVSKK